MASQTITALGSAIINLVNRKTPIATASTVGMVKPDGSTINIDANGVISSNGGGATRNIGEIVTSTIPLTDAGLHLLDGALIDGGGSYSAFVDYIADLYDSGNYTLYRWYSIQSGASPSMIYTKSLDLEDGDTVYDGNENALGTLTLYNGQIIYNRYLYVRTSSSLDIPIGLFTTETNWQAAVTNNGVCGKFVYDSVNNTVRLPKITGIIEGTTDANALGDLVEAGLPNITGKGKWIHESGTGTGAIYSETGNLNQQAAGNGGEAFNNVYFDASRSSSIYGNSTTVQPQTIKVFYYIVIATSTKTNVEVDIDEIATDLNGKADVDLTNTIGSWSSSSKDYVVMLANELDWDNAISVSTSTGTQTYTPTADGIMLLSAFSSGGSANKDVYAYFTLSGYQIGNEMLGTNSALWNTTYLYVKNNIQITYTLGASKGTSRNEVKAIFIPFKKA